MTVLNTVSMCVQVKKTTHLLKENKSFISKHLPDIHKFILFYFFFSRIRTLDAMET